MKVLKNKVFHSKPIFGINSHYITYVLRKHDDKLLNDFHFQSRKTFQDLSFLLKKLIYRAEY